MFPEKMRKLAKELYFGFPREMGTPARYPVHSFEEFEKEVEKYNEKKKVFTSLYNYTKDTVHLVVIDKIMFDFDEKDGNPFEEMKKMHNCLKKEGYKFTVVFSGRGFHIYVLTEHGDALQNPKRALEGAHAFILSLCKKVAIDRSVVGDITQLVRVVSTLNRKSTRWCCFINQKDIELGFEHIKKMAETNRFGHFQMFGDKFLDMQQFDAEPEKTIDIEFVFAGEGKQIDPTEVMKKAKPCIQQLAKTTSGCNGDRFILISYFMSEGFSKNQVESILAKFLPLEKYRHCMKENQIERIFRKLMLPPECEKLKELGHCVKEC